MANKRKAAQILRNAAKLIEKVGWHQGSYKSYASSAVCALGAINQTLRGRATSEYSSTPDENLAKEALKKVVGCNLPAWNDAYGRTREDVLRGLRETARRLEHGLQVGVYA